MNALELHGLEKHYPDFALGPIDLELPGGTVCGLIGENGAGKSTTIKLILDMIDREAGTVKLFGQEEILSLIHISEPTRRYHTSRMPSSA